MYLSLYLSQAWITKTDAKQTISPDKIGDIKPATEASGGHAVIIPFSIISSSKTPIIITTEAPNIFRASFNLSSSENSLERIIFIAFIDSLINTLNIMFVIAHEF